MQFVVGLVFLNLFNQVEDKKRVLLSEGITLQSSWYQIETSRLKWEDLALVFGMVDSFSSS
jgi:hypothetical protein